MVLNSDDKIHVIIRRRFDTDLRRHFIGEVNDATETVVRVSGYVFVLDMKTNLFVRRLQLRTRIVSLVDAGKITKILTHVHWIAIISRVQMTNNRRLYIVCKYEPNTRRLDGRDDRFQADPSYNLKSSFLRATN